MYQRILALMIKEFIAVWQDKRSRMVLIMPPIIQFFVFTFAATLDVQNVKIGILNHDNGQYSHEWIQMIRGSTEFGNIFLLENEEKVKDAINTHQALVVVKFQEDFSRKIAGKQPAVISILLDGRKSNSAQIVLGYLLNITEKYNAKFGIRENRVNSQIIERNWYNPNLIYSWFTLTGLIGVLSMLTSLSVTALSLAREKENGTFEQLLVCPFTTLEILIGKAIPALLIGVGEGSIMLLAGILFIGLPVEGNLLYFYPSMVIFILSVVGLGLFISTLARTQQQATLGVFLTAAPAVILSGFATPVENMPQWLQVIAYMNPLKYFLTIVRGVCLKGIPASVVFENVWPMLVIALCSLGGGIWFFRKRVG